MKPSLLAVALLAIVSCRSGMREPDDVVTPTFNPPIQQSLLQQVRLDPPSGENIQYMAWSIEDHRALTPSHAAVACVPPPPSGVACVPSRARIT